MNQTHHVSIYIYYFELDIYPEKHLFISKGLPFTYRSRKEYNKGVFFLSELYL